MMTSRLQKLMLLGTLAAAMGGCGPTVESGGSAGQPAPTTGAKEPASHELKYPGKSFIVHEWGTDTIVVGSDGSLQRGLHHEEEDLPGFVYDRIKAGSLPGSNSVEVKMETPVTYFYTDKPGPVSVQVGFPEGVLTQWYPAVLAFSPVVAGAHSKLGVDVVTDPVFDLAFPFDSAACAAHYSPVAGGMLNWGTVEILPPDGKIDL